MAVNHFKKLSGGFWAYQPGDWFVGVGRSKAAARRDYNAERHYSFETFFDAPRKRKRRGS